MKETTSIKPLIIGFGLAGVRHLQAQLDLGNNTGVYTQNPRKIESLKKQEGVVVFGDLNKALDWSNLVHICTPDDKHAKYVAMALKGGKAVLCEKPLTTSLLEALELQKLVKKTNGTLIVGQNYRLTPSFLETRRLIREGSIGTITGIKTTYHHDMTEYRMGTAERNIQDFLYVGGSHAVDLACWIVDQEVVDIQANVGTKIRSMYACQERYQIILRFASGILSHVSLDASSARPIHGSDVVVNGANGRIASHNKIDYLDFYTKGDKEVKTIQMPNSTTPTVSREVKIVDDFVSGKTNSHWPLPGVEEAVKIIKILDTIQQITNDQVSQRI